MAAKYIEIMEYLRDNYINNNSSQKKIPSEPQLSKLLGVSRFPINRAITELGKTGEVTRFPGIGTFVKGSEPENYRKKIQLSRTVVIVSFVGSIQADIFHGIQDVLLAQKVPFVNFFETGKLGNSLADGDILKSIVNTESFGLLVIPPLEFQTNQYKNFKALLEMAKRDNCPMVIMERPCHDSIHSRVVVDNSGGTAMVVEAMLRNGHKKVAYIGKDDYLVGEERAKGYFRALAENGLPADKDLVGLDRSGMVFMDNIEQFTNDSMDRILQKHPDCEAFMTFGISFARQVYAYLKKRNLLHENISIGGYDQGDFQENEFLRTYIGIDRPLFEVGRNSASTLLSIMNAENEVGIIIKKILPDMIMPQGKNVVIAEEYL